MRLPHHCPRPPRAALQDQRAPQACPLPRARFVPFVPTPAALTYLSLAALASGDQPKVTYVDNEPDFRWALLQVRSGRAERGVPRANRPSPTGLHGVRQAPRGHQEGSLLGLVRWGTRADAMCSSPRMPTPSRSSSAPSSREHRKRWFFSLCPIRKCGSHGTWSSQRGSRRERCNDSWYKRRCSSGTPSQALLNHLRQLLPQLPPQFGVLLRPLWRPNALQT